MYKCVCTNVGKDMNVQLLVLKYNNGGKGQIVVSQVTMEEGKV